MDAGGLRAGSHHEHVEHVALTHPGLAVLPFPPTHTQHYIVSQGGDGAAGVREVNASVVAGVNQLMGGSCGVVAWTSGLWLINVCVRMCVAPGEGEPAVSHTNAWVRPSPRPLSLERLSGRANHMTA